MWAEGFLVRKEASFRWVAGTERWRREWRGELSRRVPLPRFWGRRLKPRSFLESQLCGSGNEDLITTAIIIKIATIRQILSMIAG